MIHDGKCRAVSTVCPPLCLYLAVLIRRSDTAEFFGASQTFFLHFTPLEI